MTTETRNKIARVNSGIMFGICILFTIVILAILSIVIGYLFSIGAESFLTPDAGPSGAWRIGRLVHRINWDIFTQIPIPTGMDRAPGGMKNGILGTVMLIAMASAVGIPLGMLAGIYLSEYDVDSWMARPVRFVSDVLAGVPSIVVGILGYELLVVPLGGYNGWAGALALAFIMIPIVARTTEEMLRLVPSSYRDASIALGATKALTIVKVVIPSATGSVVTGIMLAIARVAGETAPLLFTALGSRLLETNPNRPFPSLTVQIFNYATAADRDQQRLARSGILVLITLIFLLNLAVRFATRQRHAA